MSLLRAALATYLLQAAGLLCSAATMVAVSRIFTPEQYGHFVLYLSLVTVGTFVLSGWTAMAFLRYGREEWQARGRLGEPLASQLLVALCGAVAGGLLAVLLSRQLGALMALDAGPTLLLALGLLALPLPTVASYAGQIAGRPVLLGGVALVQRAVVFAGVVTTGGLVASPSWRPLAAWSIAGAAVAGFVGFAALPRSVWRPFAPRLAVLRRMAGYSWSIPFGSFAAFVIEWVDVWVLRLYHDTRQVGLYGWTYQLVGVGTLLFSTLAILLTPRLIDVRMRNDVAALSAYCRQALVLLALLSCALLAVLPFVTPLLRWLAEPDYGEARASLLVLVGGLPFLLLGFLMAPIASAYEALVPRWAAIAAAACALNAAGDLALVPTFAGLGAAISTVLAFAFSGVAQVIVHSRHLGTRLLALPSAVILSVAPLAASALILAVPDPWLTGAACAATATLIALWLWRTASIPIVSALLALKPPRSTA